MRRLLELTRALHALGELRPEPGAVEEVQIEPAAHERGDPPAVELPQRRGEEVERRDARTAVDGEAVDQLGDVPARGRGEEILAQRAIRLAGLRLRDDVQLASLRELEHRVRERLDVSGEAAGRPACALRDGADLAERPGVERDDPIGLAEVHALEHDGLGPIGVRDGHRERL